MWPLKLFFFSSKNTQKRCYRGLLLFLFFSQSLDKCQAVVVQHSSQNHNLSISATSGSASKKCGGVSFCLLLQEVSFCSRWRSGWSCEKQFEFCDLHKIPDWTSLCNWLTVNKVINELLKDSRILLIKINTVFGLVPLLLSWWQQDSKKM